MSNLNEVKEHQQEPQTKQVHGDNCKKETCKKFSENKRNDRKWNYTKLSNETQ